MIDGMLGTGLPVSIYTTKTPIDKCRFNVPQFKEFLTFFCKRQISIKLFYLYQRLQCTDNYFFKITIGVFVVYIDTGSPVPNIPSKSCRLDNENKILTEWK
jgi:hypothetical protein